MRSLMNIRTIANEAHEKLDDWIVDQVKFENVSCNDISKQIEEVIMTDQRLSIEMTVQKNDIQDHNPSVFPDATDSFPDLSNMVRQKPTED